MRLYLLFLCGLIGPVLTAQLPVAVVNYEVDLSETVGKSSVEVASAIEFSERKGLLIVRAYTDGAWGNFILDTGAAGLVLNASTASDPTRSAAGLFGSTGATACTVQRFIWQGITRRDVPALRIDLSHIERSLGLELRGLFGYELLHRHLLAIDLPNQTVTLNPPEAKLTGLVYKLRSRGQLPVIKMRINGKVHRFGIDSGASVNVLDGHTLDRLPTSAYCEKAPRLISGAGRRSVALRTVATSEFIVGEGDVAAQIWSVADLSHLRQTQDVALDGILGRPFLEQHRVVIDYPGRKVWID